MKAKSSIFPIGVSGLLSVGALIFLGDTVSGAQAQTTSTQPQTQPQDVTQPGLLEYEQNTVSIVERYGPSVVAVNVRAQGEPVTNPALPEGLDEFLKQVPPQFRDFIQPPQRRLPEEQPLQEGSGSGFVVDEEGRIITNFHVVQAALQEESVEVSEGSSISVTFPGNEEEVPVSVVGVNTLYDLALLELQNPDNLPKNVVAIPIADSDELTVGQKTIAIGNPFGFESSVSTGIVSAISRDQQSIGQVNVPYIQTDAAINPGNSGGPLLNSQGELIGINTAIISGRTAFGPTGSLGIGFAVPSNLLSDNLAQLEEGGLVSLASRPRLGIAVLSISALPDKVHNALNLPEKGVLIQQVEAGSAASEAGLQAGELEVLIGNGSILVGGDVITAINGQAVNDASDLQAAVLSQDEGSTVTLTVLRDGEPQQVDITLAVVPEQPRNRQRDDQN